MALTKPFAEQGEKKAISLTPDAEGTMNYQDGFGQRYSLPVKSTISEDGTITTTGGLWIQREQFNQLMFDTTSAIIENQDNITQLNQDLGNKDDLTTTNKDNIVSAINELDSNIGDLQDLTTTEKSNVVSAINEIDSNYVRLDTEQTIPSVKTFSNVVNFGSIVNVNGEANFNDNVEMVNTPTITNPKTFQDLIDNELITKAQSVSKFVDFDTNQSISGLKTFTTLPQSEATPTNDKDLTTKLYVDTTLSDKIAEIGKAMGFKGIVENATDLPTDTATDGDMYYNKASSGETEDNKKGFYVFNGTAFDFIGATISMDFDKIFEIEEKQGDLTQLKTTAKDSLVNAINENYDNIATNSNNIGTLGNLTTTAKDSLVNAINENKANIDTNKSEIDSSLGDLTQLKTTAKDSLVNAINENYDSIETNSQHIADNEGAISTINENIGDLQNLTTTAKTSVVNAINEIDNSLKNNNFVTLDTNQTITSLKTFDTLPQSSVTPANDSDLVNKSYVDTQIADIDTTNLAKLDTNNQFTGENTFDIIPKSNGTPANDTDLVTKSYVDGIADNKVSKTGDETIQGTKTFNNPPVCNTKPTDDNQLANKAYVDSVVAGGNFAELDKANTFTESNTFTGEVTLSTIANTPTITNPTEWASMGDNDIPTKKQIQDNIQGGGGGNYLPLNVDVDTEVTTTAGSNAQLSLNFTDYTIAQGATFEISNQENNIQFAKDAGINNIKLNQNLEFKLDSNINAGVVADLYTQQKFGEAFNIPPYHSVITWDVANYTDLAPKYVMIGNYTIGSAALVVGDYWYKNDGSGEAIATSALVANDTARMQASQQSAISIGNNYDFWNGIFLQETTTQIMMYGTNETNLRDDVTLNWYIRGQKNDSITMQNSKGFLGLGDNLTISGIGKYSGNYSVFSANNGILIGSAPFKNSYSLGGIDKQNNTYTMVDKATLGEEYLENGHIIVSEFDVSIASKDSIDMKTRTINAIGDTITIGDDSTNNLNINLVTSGTITLNDKAKSEFQRVLDIGGGGSGGVTLNTEQTITGNKFFQADENANQFVRFYPTPTQIEGGGSNYVAHMGGYVLIGKDDSVHPNNSLIIDIPTQRTLYFTNTSGNRRGSVAFEDSISLQGFNVSYNSKLLGSSYNTLEGSFFNDMAWAGSGSYLGNSCIGVGHITDGNDESGAFIATPYNLYITLADSTSELVLNDKAKSEFQRVLEIPNTTNLAKLDSNNTFTSASNQTFNGNVDINGILNAGDTNFYGNNTFYSNNFIKASLIVANNNANQELAITPIANGVSINLGDDCTLTMNARMISELKRLLGIS